MRIGIDWGGTKIEAIALSEQGEILKRKRIPTPRDYASSISDVTALVNELEAGEPDKASIGIGIPGCLSPATGLVKGANSTWLNGKPLDLDLGQALGRPVRIENDANCLAVSEAVDGAGTGQTLVWAIILGTGVGSGIAIEGRPLKGREGIAGEWGHNPLPWPKPDEIDVTTCWCGQKGCIETWVSGTGFAVDHKRVTGEGKRAEEIIAAMHAGDPAAKASFARYMDRLGRAVAHVVNILDPDAIVIGGGMSNVSDIFESLRDKAKPYVFSDRFSASISPAKHGDSSGVRGAAWLWGKKPQK
jgi:fructokinase